MILSQVRTPSPKNQNENKREWEELISLQQYRLLAICSGARFLTLYPYSSLISCFSLTLLPNESFDSRSTLALSSSILTFSLYSFSAMMVVLISHLNA